LETLSQDFVLETKRIEIPGYPYAFNPSILRWKEFILMTFRVIPDSKQSFTSQLGIVLLDPAFNPIGEPQILETRDIGSSIPTRAEDARLIEIGGRIYIIYSDNCDPVISRGGFRMVVGELIYEKGFFSIRKATRLLAYDGERSDLREKNWVSFGYKDKLMLAYSLDPHLVFEPLGNTGVCKTVALSFAPIAWNWGILRGGTPALLLDTEEYFAFFHSSTLMATAHSKGEERLHYFIGAYTFEPHPPFRILRQSPSPIVAPGFYSGASYKHYWKPVHCVFPSGLLLDGKFFWLSYGRQDHEIWVAKLDKKKLLDSLVKIGP
jgi:predicted GH43/DUF377 family glycosyl hydrolase